MASGLGAGVPDGAVHGRIAVCGIPAVSGLQDFRKIAIAHGQRGDGLHDDPGITLNIMMTDPKMVRRDERVKAGKATINGVSIADRKKTEEWGRKIVEMRATNTVAAIKKAIADRRK